MTKAEAKDLDVKKVVIGKLNPRAIVKKELEGSELYTSIKNNGVQHPIEVNKKGATYILLSGERRLTISKSLKLPTIPAIIYNDLSEEEMYNKMHFENASREDLSPLEQAVDAQNLMKIFKGDATAVASKLGVSVRNVRMRIAVNKLIPQWKKLAEDEEYSFTIAHLEVIARCPVCVQADLLNNLYDIDEETVSGLEDFIQERYMCVLDEVEFDKAECEKCKKRSDAEEQIEMWSTGKKKEVVRCLDSKCFEKKKREHLKASLDAIKEKHKDVVVMTYTWNESRDCEAAGIKCVRNHEVEACKKADAGAMPAVTLGKNNIRYVRKPQSEAKASTRPTDKEGKVIPKTMKERREDLKGLRMKMVNTELRNKIEESVLPDGWDLTNVTALALSLGVSLSSPDGMISDYDKLASGKTAKFNLGWNHKKSEYEKANYTLLDAMWSGLRKDLSRAVSVGTSSEAVEKEKLMKTVAEWVGFDFDKSFAKAVEEKTEPKGWANLNPDGTPKKG